MPITIYTLLLVLVQGLVTSQIYVAGSATDAQTNGNASPRAPHVHQQIPKVGARKTKDVPPRRGEANTNGESRRLRRGSEVLDEGLNQPAEGMNRHKRHGPLLLNGGLFEEIVRTDAPDQIYQFDDYSGELRPSQRAGGGADERNDVEYIPDRYSSSDGETSDQFENDEEKLGLNSEQMKAVFQDILLNEPPRNMDQDSETDDVSWDENGVILPHASYRSRMKKAGFDSISEGALSGLFQNYMGGKRLNSIDGGRFAGTGQKDVKRRTFDSDRGYPNELGMDQNVPSKRRLDSISSGHLSGLNQNFLTRRGFDSFARGPLSGMKQNHLNKRGFDSISSSGVSGMRQNFLSKRLDSISGGAFSGLRQNFLGGKRYFDSQDEGRLRGVGTNHLNKRSFDSINSGALRGLQRRFMEYKRLGSLSDGVLRVLRHHFLTNKHHNHGRLGGMSQNLLVKRDATRNGDKRFDSISEGSLGGIRQNFLSKRSFDSINDDTFHAMGQNYLDRRDLLQLSQSLRQRLLRKRQFDSINDGSLSGINQHFLGKRFDSINRGSLSGMNQNFVGKRFGSIDDGSPSHTAKNILDRRFDSINEGMLSGINPKMLRKRFDSINGGSLSGLGQNFLGKRFDSIDGNFSGMRHNFLDRPDVEDLESHFMNKRSASRDIQNSDHSHDKGAHENESSVGYEHNSVHNSEHATAKT